MIMLMMLVLVLGVVGVAAAQTLSSSHRMSAPNQVFRCSGTLGVIACSHAPYLHWDELEWLA